MTKRTSYKQEEILRVMRILGGKVYIRDIVKESYFLEKSSAESGLITLAAKGLVERGADERGRRVFWLPQEGADNTVVA